MPVAYINGASGKIGSHITKAFATKGFHVVVASRDASRVADLVAAFPGKVHAVQADAETEAGVDSVLKFIDEKLDGQLDHVVSSFGSGLFGVDTFLPAPAGEKKLHEVAIKSSIAHFNVASKTLPRLADKTGASFTFITGGVGESYFPGWGAGLTTIKSSFEYGISIQARGETQDKAVRVNEARLNYLVTAKDIPEGKAFADLVLALATGTKAPKGEVVKANTPEETAKTAAGFL